MYTTYILLFLPATPLLCVPGWVGGGTLVPSEVLLPRQLYLFCTTLVFMPRRLLHLFFLLFYVYCMDQAGAIQGWGGGGTLVPSEVLLPRQLYLFCTTLVFMPRRLLHLFFLLFYVYCMDQAGAIQGWGGGGTLVPSEVLYPLPPLPPLYTAVHCLLVQVLFLLPHPFFKLFDTVYRLQLVPKSFFAFSLYNLHTF